MKSISKLLIDIGPLAIFFIFYTRSGLQASILPFMIATVIAVLFSYILEKKIPQEYHASCKSILRVCAFTYVIGSLTSILDVRKIWFLFRAVMFRR